MAAGETGEEQMHNPYPPEQMHRIAYTQLTEAQIAEKQAGVWKIRSVTYLPG